MFPKIVVPQNGWWKSWKTLLKWMTWGFSPYFWFNTQMELYNPYLTRLVTSRVLLQPPRQWCHGGYHRSQLWPTQKVGGYGQALGISSKFTSAKFFNLTFFAPEKTMLGRFKTGYVKALLIAKFHRNKPKKLGWNPKNHQPGFFTWQSLGHHCHLHSLKLTVKSPLHI